MTQHKICLASDNWAPAHPLILNSVIEANEGCAPSYGTDPWTLEAQNTIQNAFKQRCKVFIVPSGTGSNILALKLSCLRHESVICTDISHIQYQESGAAESIIGCNLCRRCVIFQLSIFLFLRMIYGMPLPHKLIKELLKSLLSLKILRIFL